MGAPANNQNAAKENGKTSFLHMRIKPEEKAAYVRAAKIAKQCGEFNHRDHGTPTPAKYGVTEWATDILNKAAKDVLKD